MVAPTCAATAIPKSRPAATTIPAIRSAPWRRTRSRSWRRSASTDSWPPVMTAAHAFCTACASTIRDKVERAAILDIIPQHYLYSHINKRMGDVFLALVLQHPALRHARAHDGRRSGLVHREEARQDQAGPELLRPGGARRIQALLPQSGDHPRHLRGLPRRRRHRSRARTRRTSRPAARSNARCCCWGATGGVGRNHNPGPAEIWKSYATNIVGAQALPCGHYLSEEAPQETTQRCARFSPRANKARGHRWPLAT